MAMLTAYIRTTAKAAGAPMDFAGPMAKQHRMALATGLAVWCAVIPGEIGGPAAVWAVLVDCDLAPRMVRRLKSCRIVERDSVRTHAV